LGGHPIWNTGGKKKDKKNFETNVGWLLDIISLGYQFFKKYISLGGPMLILKYCFGILKKKRKILKLISNNHLILFFLLMGELYWWLPYFFL
jgi:hypothetical protein